MSTFSTPKIYATIPIELVERLIEDAGESARLAQECEDSRRADECYGKQEAYTNILRLLQGEPGPISASQASLWLSGKRLHSIKAYRDENPNMTLLEVISYFKCQLGE